MAGAQMPARPVVQSISLREWRTDTGGGACTSFRSMRMARPGRLPAGVALCAVGLVVITGILVQLGTHMWLASIFLLYLLIVVATAVVGGLTAALAAAVA